MKEIIYLNTDFINSFMAQTFKGLPVDTTEEQMQQDSQSSSDITQRESLHNVTAELSSGSINIPLIMMSPSGQLSYKYTNGKMLEEAISLTQVDAGREIISKKLHDNALNEFLDYLEDNQKLIEVDFGSVKSNYLGKYVKITSEFNLFDLDFVAKMVNTPVMKELFRIMPELAGEPSSTGGKSKGKNYLPNPIKQGMEMFDLIMNYLSAVLPTNLFLKTNGFVAPLKTEYLRESSSELNFKYGSGSNIQVTIVGRATKAFESFGGDTFLGNGTFKEVADAMSEALEIITNEIKTINEGDIIVSPVAIYFE